MVLEETQITRLVLDDAQPECGVDEEEGKRLHEALEDTSGQVARGPQHDVSSLEKKPDNKERLAIAPHVSHMLLCCQVIRATIVAKGKFVFACCVPDDRPLSYRHNLHKELPAQKPTLQPITEQHLWAEAFNGESHSEKSSKGITNSIPAPPPSPSPLNNRRVWKKSSNHGFQQLHCDHFDAHKRDVIIVTIALVIYLTTASTLFLTRRLPESLSTILPVITPPVSDDTSTENEPAPISKASRTTRIKVWSLYLTILNAVVELDPDEGKQAFGSSDWRALVSKVRDGEVWEDVVKNGYGGVEGDVDSDVVINLATLLLAHARTQKINQTRLENYLATSTQPNLDISSRLQSSSQRTSRTQSPHKGGGGTDTPRDLNARVKILELYTLHVLLRNNEWDYAREFITISSVLDEERREAFLQALQSLQDEQHEAEQREREERRYQEEQLKKDIEDARRRRVENEERERKREEEERLKKEGSEIDYGVEESRPGTSHSRKPASVKSTSSSTRKPPPSTARSSAPPATRKPTTMISRAANIISNIRKLIMEGMIGGFRTKPMFLLQILAFVVGFLVVMSRSGVRERVKRAWEKVLKTAGMGVKEEGRRGGV
ncbi:hypothetical protein G7Y89_g13292 [Cudoniella acicularis]|uniref:Peroxin 26 n=1 Tax=Cudoniella acicularis TaxID=354080 RepID=A0A8H4RA61_9HELO|nr:hypothetical protein G7Y89_g13292 [Cudoniella acicularis]